MTELLEASAFSFSAEIIPPRNGAEQGDVLSQIETLFESGAEFLSVTKGAGGSLRGGSLPIAQAIKERFKRPAIAHFTCRDLTPEEVENSLMDHFYFGIRNILALRGDPPVGQPDWKPKEGSYPYAHHLIEQIRRLNEGVFLNRPRLPKSSDVAEAVGRQMQTDFCIGSACYPEHPDPKERIQFFEQKIRAGASYGITQMLFDPDVYARFLQDSLRAGIEVPVLPGVRVLRSKKMAERMRDQFKVSVPDWYIRDLPDEYSRAGDDVDSLAQALIPFLRLVSELRAEGAPGIHLFVIGDARGSAYAISELKRQFNAGVAK